MWGFQDNEKIMDFYRNNPIDIFINVSTNEGVPVSIMEAISFGIPIIATNVGGTNEIVINNITGWLVDKDKVEKELPDALMAYYQLIKMKKIRFGIALENFGKKTLIQNAIIIIFIRT